MKDMDQDTSASQDLDVQASAKSRRRFLGAGTATAVLASLKTGSALAEGVCVAPSAYTSIALNPATSSRPAQMPVCHSHGYWKTHEGWLIPRDAKVKDHFCRGAGTAAIGITETTTLLNVLNAEAGVISGGDAAYARDLISAYLDSKTGGFEVIKSSDIQSMWSLVFCGGTYSVNGTVWTKATVRTYLDVLIGSSINPFLK